MRIRKVSRARARMFCDLLMIVVRPSFKTGGLSNNTPTPRHLSIVYQS